VFGCLNQLTRVSRASTSAYADDRQGRRSADSAGADRAFHAIHLLAFFPGASVAALLAFGAAAARIKKGDHTLVLAVLNPAMQDYLAAPRTSLAHRPQAIGNLLNDHE